MAQLVESLHVGWLVCKLQQKDELANQLRQDLRVLRDEFTACQRRNKQMLAEADAAELELSRRDLKLKV